MKDYVVYSVPRSAGTLVTNLVGEIIGRENVRDSHTYEVFKDGVIVCIRDFRDCMVSMNRQTTNNIGQLDFIDVIRNVLYFRRQLFTLRKYEKDGNLLILRYERFVNDFDYIFDKLEGYFGVRINKKKREELKEKHGLKQMKTRLESNKGNYMGFKRGHIVDGKVGKWSDMIPSRYHFIVYMMMRKQLLRYGYSRNRSVDFEREAWEHDFNF